MPERSAMCGDRFDLQALSGVYKENESESGGEGREGSLESSRLIG